MGRSEEKSVEIQYAYRILIIHEVVKADSPKDTTTTRSIGIVYRHHNFEGLCYSLYQASVHWSPTSSGFMLVFAAILCWTLSLGVNYRIICINILLLCLKQNYRLFWLWMRWNYGHNDSFLRHVFSPSQGNNTSQITPILAIC
jgi:hypothetical protein